MLLLYLMHWCFVWGHNILSFEEWCYDLHSDATWCCMLHWDVTSCYRLYLDDLQRCIMSCRMMLYNAGRYTAMLSIAVGCSELQCEVNNCYKLLNDIKCCCNVTLCYLLVLADVAWCCWLLQVCVFLYAVVRCYWMHWCVVWGHMMLPFVSWCSRISTVAVWCWLLLYAVVVVGVSWCHRMWTVAVWC